MPLCSFIFIQHHLRHLSPCCSHQPSLSWPLIPRLSCCQSLRSPFVRTRNTYIHIYIFIHAFYCQLSQLLPTDEKSSVVHLLEQPLHRLLTDRSCHVVHSEKCQLLGIYCCRRHSCKITVQNFKVSFLNLQLLPVPSRLRHSATHRSLTTSPPLL